MTRKKATRKNPSRKLSRLEKWSAWGVAATFLGTFIGIKSCQDSRATGSAITRIENQTKLEGVLEPGDAPNPPAPCLLPAPAFLVYLGSNVYILRDATKTFVVNHQGERLLDISVTEGGLLVSSLVRSRDGRVVARLDKNRFFVNPNNYFRIERADSRLAVYDQYNALALEVNYLNRSAVRINGFWDFPASSVHITSSKLTLNGHDPLIDNACLEMRAANGKGELVFFLNL